MNGTTHFFFGITTAATIMIAGSANEAFLFGSAIGSLLPDIDHQNSTIGKAVPFISKPLHNLLGHRTITHAPFLLTILCFVLPINQSMNGLLFGCLGHLLLDFLTRDGLPLLYPFTKEKQALMKFRSGSAWSKFFTFLLAATFFIAILCIKKASS